MTSSFVLASLAATLLTAQSPPADARPTALPRHWQADLLTLGPLARLAPTVLRHDGVVFAVAFAPDGRMLATGGSSQTIYLRDPGSGTVKLRCLGHTSNVNALAFAPSGKVLASGGGDRTVRLWDAQTGQELRRLTGHTEPINSV